MYVIQVYRNDKVKGGRQEIVPPPLASLVGGPLHRSDSDESAEKRKAKLKARVRVDDFEKLSVQVHVIIGYCS